MAGTTHSSPKSGHGRNMPRSRYAIRQPALRTARAGLGRSISIEGRPITREQAEQARDQNLARTLAQRNLQRAAQRSA